MDEHFFEVWKGVPKVGTCLEYALGIGTGQRIHLGIMNAQLYLVSLITTKKTTIKYWREQGKEKKTKNHHNS